MGASTLAVLPLRARDGRLAVYYGGARAGDFGGTLVKVRLLQQRFPERVVGFNLAYLLSNAIYLPQFVIDAVRSAGVPVVFNQNGVFYPGWYPAGWEQQNARMAKAHAVADHVFYQSEFCRRCAQKFLGDRNGDSQILYNGVDVERFSPATRAEKNSPFTFLLAGKIGPDTGYRLTSSIAGLAAARKGGLDVRLVIAGLIDPAVEAEARRDTEALGVADAVTFTGPYHGPQAPAIYRAADAYLMTKYADPCPNTVLEALASGLPVLYSASGGVPELVGEAAGEGLAVPETFDDVAVPEPRAIAEGMARIIDRRQAMGEAARARAVERFSLANWFDVHETVFRRLLAERVGA